GGAPDPGPAEGAGRGAGSDLAAASCARDRAEGSASHGAPRRRGRRRWHQRSAGERRHSPQRDAGLVSRGTRRRRAARARVRAVMPDAPSAFVSPSRVPATFPMLSPGQMNRVAAHGSVRHVENGEILVEAGDSRGRFFVARTAAIEVVRPSTLADTMVATVGPGMFTGEANMLLGRRSLVRVRASAAGDVIELTRDQVLAL